MFACRKTSRPRKRNLVAPVLSSLLNLPAFKRSNLQTPLCVSPFPATLTDDPQLTENPATLSPVPATLTSRVKHNPFVCHSYKKHPGWGYTFQSKIISPFSCSPVSNPNPSGIGTDEETQGQHTIGPAGSGGTANPGCPLPSFTAHGSRVTDHDSSVTKSCRIRTSAKPACNPCRIRTSKTQDLKPFRMNTYEKTGEGEKVSVPKSIAAHQARFRIRVRGV
jgi:hypothetical protein